MMHMDAERTIGAIVDELLGPMRGMDPRMKDTPGLCLTVTVKGCRSSKCQSLDYAGREVVFLFQRATNYTHVWAVVYDPKVNRPDIYDPNLKWKHYSCHDSCWQGDGVERVLWNTRNEVYNELESRFPKRKPKDQKVEVDIELGQFLGHHITQHVNLHVESVQVDTSKPRDYKVTVTPRETTVYTGLDQGRTQPAEKQS